MELREIKTLIDLVTKNDLSEFDLEQEGFKIRIKRGEKTVVGMMPVANPIPPLPATPQPVSSPAPDALAPAPTGGLKEILSPMVGTFYRTPAPDAPPLVEVGTHVTEDTVVCIIEAMKVMNEIKAEQRGTIVEILVENGKSTEFGKPLFRLKPD
jgi:acetyl-CoA carboxylase biotin carboxyl carrier protein